jgi:6-phosphogluconolactonase
VSRANGSTSSSSQRQVQCLDDAQALCEFAADEFATASDRAIEARGVFRIALAGGSTPCRLHRILTQAPYREQIAWDRIEFFFGDERTVHPNHSNSNYRMARETLLTELNIASERVHRMHAENHDLAGAARDYEQELASAFDIKRDSPPPRFDLILLGMGTDGHTASLFPETEALHERKRWVVGNDVPKLGVRRMTFTYPLINAAERVLFLISGQSKAPALAAILDGPPDPSRLPSQGVTPSDGKLLFLIDRAAGKLLQPATRKSTVVETE